MGQAALEQYKTGLKTDLDGIIADVIELKEDNTYIGGDIVSLEYTDTTMTNTCVNDYFFLSSKIILSILRLVIKG